MSDKVSDSKKVRPTDTLDRVALRPLAYIVNTLRGKNSLRAFGNNSAESEPIWMNLEECEPNDGLALADFRRDLRSSDRLRGVVFSKKRKNFSQNFQVLRLQAVITP